MKRAGLTTIGFTIASLILNLVTGIIAARLLHANGRGALVAIQQFPSIGTWIFGMGAGQALAFFIARDEGRAPCLVSAWLVFLLPCIVLAVGVEELLLPVLLSAQSDHTLDIARLWAPTVGLAIYLQVAYGIALGKHRFFLYNFGQFLYPLLMTAGFCLFWKLGRLTVGHALLSSLIGSVVSLVFLFTVLLKGSHLARPDWRLGGESFWYGFRAHWANLTSTVNTRLDILIMPAILSATSVGLYSVVTNVSWIVVVCAGALFPLVLPIAARRGDAAAVIQACQATFAIAAVLVAVGEVVAPVAIRMVYGSRFLPATPALRILLPGSAFMAMAQVLWSGLLAQRRPLTAAATQIPGIVITLAGLLLFLRMGGINAAAWVSTVSYFALFVLAWGVYCRVARVPPTRFFMLPIGVQRGRTRVEAA